jgi:hypothetical protein
MQIRATMMATATPSPRAKATTCESIKSLRGAGAGRRPRSPLGGSPAPLHLDEPGRHEIGGPIEGVGHPDASKGRAGQGGCPTSGSCSSWTAWTPSRGRARTSSDLSCLSNGRHWRPLSSCPYTGHMDCAKAVWGTLTASTERPVPGRGQACSGSFSERLSVPCCGKMSARGSQP